MLFSLIILQGCQIFSPPHAYSNKKYSEEELQRILKRREPASQARGFNRLLSYCLSSGKVFLENQEGDEIGLLCSVQKSI